MRKRIPVLFEKRLILIRHAHRETGFGDDRDNGLSPKGKKQLLRLKKVFKKRLPKIDSKETLILSSPKKRCLETIAPLAEYAKVKVAEYPLIGEGPNIQERAREFIKEWKRMDAPLTIICSHGDFLPVLVEELTGVESVFPKAGYAELGFSLWDGP